MAECLLVATKNIEKSAKNKRAVFVNLNECPNSPLMGAEIAEEIHKKRRTGQIVPIESGLQGNTAIMIGDQKVGSILSATLPSSGSWGVARTSDMELAQSAYQMLVESCCWLPGTSTKNRFGVKLKYISEMGVVGPYHADIDAHSRTGIRGPFQVTPLENNEVPTFPLLWAHEAKREIFLTFEADCQAIKKKTSNSSEQKTVEAKSEKIWQTASFFHFNSDFRFNSQPMAAQITSRRTIGGRAWPSLRMKTIEQEIALAIWCNTSLGLLCHWWQATKQQDGRGSIGILGLRKFLAWDVLSLSSDQLLAAKNIMKEFKHLPFLPVNEINKDSTRALLDERAFGDVFGLKIEKEALLLLREKLSAEPSIHGGKKTSTFST